MCSYCHFSRFGPTDKEFLRILEEVTIASAEHLRWSEVMEMVANTNLWLSISRELLLFFGINLLSFFVAKIIYLLF